ncbi:hypothetical protein HAPAU_22460 [Halalkalicoccus paucihalophilus]|uniref:Transcriptional regulator PadR-like family protein n=1 Tax=Halalkalicoccus paucihalophilus TaxID=1008153 RepID=A0A151ADG2_9EURY|nr:hypothetical protein [Halalkalicoccus paucihalophilus]KYH25572.1 hypothetical protein HAPAU_22460 [Halalkalicoccus paucihalophilus]
MNVSTTVQRDLLYVIAGHEDPTERTLKRTLESYYRTEIRPDRLASSLDALCQRGLVERVDRAETNYSLTKRGRHEIEARREWESGYFDPKRENK